jgi:2-C-methyl-D-erythritol 2,4-cyclodiphosphate synthase
VGHGFDLHRLAEGYKLVIGGIEIPHTKGCEAHSDGAAGLREHSSTLQLANSPELQHV